VTSIRRFEFHAMASPCEIAIGSSAKDRAQAAADFAIAEVKRIEAKYSRFTSNSVVARINERAASEPVAIDDETRALLNYADRIHAISGGLFDITTGLFQQAWDFRAGTIAAPERLLELKQDVGWSHVRLTSQGIFFMQPRMRIDFGGFGKEYAADRAADVLRQQGVSSGYVNLGGDVAAIGMRPDGEPWSMGVQHPRSTAELIASIPLADAALATSGDYERYFERNGRRYCHVLSPLTGEPVSHWQSVSVIAPRAITAGATATVTMLLEASGLEFLHKSGLPFLAVNPEGEVFTHRKAGQFPPRTRHGS